MIVNYTASGWQIITQRSHGLLAAQICAAWREKPIPARWTETLIATAEHDDVYNEFENDDLLNEKGGPVNFKETVFVEDYCETLIKMAETKSVYIALLIARHIHFVHGEDLNAKSFFNRVAKRESKWLKAADLSKKEVAIAYDLLQFCDAFSLLICQGLIQPEGRKMEISRGPDGKAYEMFASGKEQISVTPWPFEQDSILVSYETRTLSKLVFSDVIDFRNEVSSAKVNTQRLKISKAQPAKTSRD